MISVDGSLGEGGGQILRTSIALSAVAGVPVRIENIRAKRENPGIRPQHLQAVEAMRKLCGAEVFGAEAGSKILEFTPKKIAGGSISLSVGTAGSIALVLQPLLIAAMRAEKKVSASITGGTDVPWSPTVDYLQHVTLPVLKGFGYIGEIKTLRRGYYPVGGGRVEVEITPCRMKEINLLEPGRLLSMGGVSHAHRTLETADVAGRQCKAARGILYARRPDAKLSIRKEYADAACLGSGVSLWAQTEYSVFGASSLGEKGKRAEEVGKAAAETLLKEIESDVGLDVHMGDQIVPYLALAGGEASVSKVTEHLKSNVFVANLFGYDVRIEGNTLRCRGVR